MLLDDEDLTPFRILLPAEAVARLMQLAEESHADPRALASALLMDVLRDDFEAHHVPPGFSSENPLH